MTNRSSSDESGPVHKPVLLREVVQFLDLIPQLTVVDGTVGAGGHSAAICPLIEPDGTLLGFDRDPMMLDFANDRLSEFGSVQLIHSSYVHLREQLDELKIDAVDRVLVDLGLSSDQLEDRTRGFGFKAGGTLDLRFDTTGGQSASELLRTASAEDLADIFQTHGEEKFARQIANAICQQRRHDPVETTEQLEAICAASMPGKVRGGKNPATRVVQALRIAVNDELEHLQRSLDTVFYESVRPGGRVVVITFHSIEDRMVKQAFRRKDQWQNLTPKPVAANPAELRMNPRARSAKLRAAKRL
jgi:16S rRNA (cytosine1402-N4)-methyltransferase